jgi:hypothetical protein
MLNDHNYKVNPSVICTIKPVITRGEEFSYLHLNS